MTRWFCLAGCLEPFGFRHPLLSLKIMCTGQTTRIDEAFACISQKLIICLISCQSLVHLVIFAHALHEVFSGAMAGALLGCGYFLLLRRRPSKDDKFQHEKTTTVYESMSLVCSLLLSTQQHFCSHRSSTLSFSVGTLRSSPQGAAAAWPGSAGAWLCRGLPDNFHREEVDLWEDVGSRGSGWVRTWLFHPWPGWEILMGRDYQVLICFNGFHFLSLMGRSWKISNEGGI